MQMACQHAIHYAWSVLANALTNVTLANYLSGEFPPKDEGSPENEVGGKEAIVFDVAIDNLCGSTGITGQGQMY